MQIITREPTVGWHVHSKGIAIGLWIVFLIKNLHTYTTVYYNTNLYVRTYSYTVQIFLYTKCFYKACM